ncbi:MAG: single-stranded DNA-binding protein [Ruminococcus sp.]|nr:single-stranded DNA-binding protein [Ruminococcus sp.]
MNKVILVGRLTADPELRQTQSGISSCRFRIAVDRRFVDKSTGERQTDFFNCVAWRQQAEFVSRYFSKGKLIALDGSIRNSNYQDKKYPDVTHYSMEIFVDNVEFVGGKGDGGSPQQQNNTYQAPRPQQAAAPQQPAPANDNMSYGNFGEYEELLNEDDMPF